MGWKQHIDGTIVTEIFLQRIVTFELFERQGCYNLIFLYMSCIYSKKALELLYTTKANSPTVLAGICDKVQAKASLLINLVFIDFKNNILIVTT